ncbi:hypothetical protein BDP67DRAFT_389646, partial [Colletotrichum lupini]
PALVIKYKVLYKLRRNEVITSLDLEIKPERDVINKDSKGFRFILKSLVTAIIT